MTNALLSKILAAESSNLMTPRGSSGIMAGARSANSSNVGLSASSAFLAHRGTCAVGGVPRLCGVPELFVRRARARGRDLKGLMRSPASAGLHGRWRSSRRMKGEEVRDGTEWGATIPELKQSDVTSQIFDSPMNNQITTEQQLQKNEISS